MTEQKDRNPEANVGRRMAVELQNGTVFEAVLAEISPSKTYLRFDTQAEGEQWLRLDAVKDFELLATKRKPTPFPPS